jgi:hypothetical protein
MKFLFRLALITSTVLGAFAGLWAIALAKNFVDQFPLHRQTKYFDFHFKRDSSSVAGIVRAGGIRLFTEERTGLLRLPIRWMHSARNTTQLMNLKRRRVAAPLKCGSNLRVAHPSRSLRGVGLS